MHSPRSRRVAGFVAEDLHREVARNSSDDVDVFIALLTVGSVVTAPDNP